VGKRSVTRGIIHIHPKGFGFVSSEDSKSYTQDIFIPKHLKKNAVDGDRVEIVVYAKKQSARRGPEGNVLRILRRGKKHLVGVVWTIDKKGNYVLYIQSLGRSKNGIIRPYKGEHHQIGERLVLQVIDWGDENSPLLCRAIETLGMIDNASTDVPAATKDFGISTLFPSEVIEQMRNFPKEVREEDLEGRMDLAYLETFTIDPDDAKDFDDALSLSEDQSGHFHLGVHIADVAHYVREGVPLDSAAKMRGNSTYFPGSSIPMLPEELSNHLCSLKEGVVRLTVSVLVELDAQGTTLNHKILRSYIRSKKRFTYKQAKKVLDEEVKSPHYDTLKQMEKLCYILKKKRFERGSFDLALPDLVILVDGEGRPYGYEEVQYDITHQIVEEFMLKANEIVAKDFMSRNLPSVYRIHEMPTSENLEDFYALARSLGFTVSDKPTAMEIQRLFSLAKQTPYARHISLSYIRSMKLAFYSHQNVGHYGLALENYCHFTSPIRRYSDLVVHRLLFDVGSSEDLEKISKRCSERERVSFKSEMYVITLKKLRLLKLYYEKNSAQIYPAVINKVKSFGIFFEISPVQFEGFLHVSDLGGDYYDFHDKTHTLTGQNSGRSFSIGSALELLLENVDLILMESKWTLKPAKEK